MRLKSNIDKVVTHNFKKVYRNGIVDGKICFWSLDGYRHLTPSLRVFTTNRHKVIVGYLTADNYIFNSGHDFAFMLKIKKCY